MAALTRDKPMHPDNEISSRNTPLVSVPPEMTVGLKIKELRNKSGFSLRELSDRTGLNINTLSLIENGKSSPSVSTLQQLANGLTVPITAFFESAPIGKQIVWTPQGTAQKIAFGQTVMENLGKDLSSNAVQPFLVTLKQDSDSGEPLIVHTGYEFVYCLAGKVSYTIEHNEFTLEPGDSLVFEAHFPHRWKNIHTSESQIILVLFPADQREEFGGRHFSGH